MIDLRETHGGNDIGPGTVVMERWRAEELLEDHGPLTTWLGVELSSGRPVKIVRVPHAADPIQKMVTSEKAQALDVLIHPSLPCPLAVDVTGADAMLVVYEMVSGEPLAKAVQSGAFTPDRVIALGSGLLDALAACHAVGLAFREIKPENVRLVDGVDGERLVLDDLPLRGLVAVATDSARRPRTGVTGPMLRAAGRIHEDDMVAAGEILHLMLVGRPVLDARRTADYRLLDPSVLLGPPAADIPYEGPLVDFIRHCLAPNPSHRPASAGDARDALMRIPEPADAARPRRVRHATAIFGSAVEHLRVEHLHQLAEQWRQDELDRRTAPVESLVPQSPQTGRVARSSPIALTTGVMDALRPRRRWQRPAALGAVVVAAMLLTWVVLSKSKIDEPGPMAEARALANVPVEASSPPVVHVAAKTETPAVVAPATDVVPAPAVTMKASETATPGPVVRATVTSAPLGASIIVDGKNVGVTPMTLAWEAIGNGKLDVQLELAGHQRSTLTLDANASGHVVRVEMQPN